MLVNLPKDKRVQGNSYVVFKQRGVSGIWYYLRRKISDTKYSILLSPKFIKNIFLSTWAKINTAFFS
jgi:hypothetical protein